MLAFLSAISARVWAYLAGGLAVLVLLTGIYVYGYHSGKTTAEEKAAKEMQAYTDQVLIWQAEQNARTEEREKRHDQQISNLRAEFAREQAAAAEQDATIIADLRAGAERLRFKARNCSTAQTGSADPSPGGVDGAGTVELAPETSAALWGIAADGDRAIRKLTALQEWARSAVELCGAQPEEEP